MFLLAVDVGVIFFVDAVIVDVDVVFMFLLHESREMGVFSRRFTRCDAGKRSMLVWQDPLVAVVTRHRGEFPTARCA